MIQQSYGAKNDLSIRNFTYFFAIFSAKLYVDLQKSGKFKYIF